MFFQPEIETMPREELRELQLERMRESLRNAYENVPLYRERFDAAGVTPDDLTSLEDIAKFPYRPRLVLDGVGDIPGPAEQ